VLRVIRLINFNIVRLRSASVLNLYKCVLNFFMGVVCVGIFKDMIMYRGIFVMWLDYLDCSSDSHKYLMESISCLFVS
jgi:hypothetical protein